MDNLKLVLIAFIIAMFVTFVKDSFIESKHRMSEPPAVEQQSENIVNIRITPMREFSGMSAEEVLNLRKNAVKNSVVFSSIKNYKPNPDVYQIEDGLQWISAYEISCNGSENNPDIGRGDSRESVGILNPEMMFHIIVASLKSKERNYCSDADYLIPYKLTYNPKTNTINSFINYTAFRDKHQSFRNIVPGDANAHDLGYNWVYADLSNNIRYKYDDNISNRIIQTKGFYHRGYACGLPEGCNNYSPYEQGYEFYLTDLPAMINIKLWKSKPLTKNQKAELNYRMIFN